MNAFTAPAVTATHAVPNALPASLSTNPRLSQWLSIHADGTVSVRSGKVELGQGIATALAQIVAQELDVSLSRIRMIPANTATSPNEGMTAGSMSVHDSGSALRQVCAEVHAIYLHLAAQRLGLSQDQSGQLAVVDGVISVAGPAAGNALTTSYWALADESLLDREADARAKPKAATHDREPGTGGLTSRMDLPDKVTGRPRFIQDMRLPGMLYGRVVHPPSPGAVLQSVDASGVQAQPGVVAVVRDGSFLGVIADDEYSALLARDKLAAAARWHTPPTLPDMTDLGTWLRSQPLDTSVVG